MDQHAIFITGGAGFLGRAIVATAAREQWNSRITIYSRDETKQEILARRYAGNPHVRLAFVLGDIQDEAHLQAAMTGHDVVIHAGAVKYIPEAERNTWECARVNVLGSMNVARAAGRAGVQRCLAISTDKVVEPVNQYGRTKATMEALFAEAGRWWPGCQYASVRYGNVIGSTGSVIPLFTQQAQRRRITVTNPEMTRFWLSPEQAVSLVVDALEDMPRQPGGTFVRDCPAMRIGDLAEACIIAAAVPREQVEIITIGTRPGEKKHECLLGFTEAPRALYWREGFVIPTQPESAQWDPPGGRPGPYYSDQPSRYLGPLDMVELIHQAEEI